LAEDGGDLRRDRLLDGAVVGAVAGDEFFDEVVQGLGRECVDRQLDPVLRLVFGHARPPARRIAGPR